ncbi:hypothetical protein [uncultured Agitococcus sp.]|uniref:hypothetical protein n=1 Tax=uncultured Agitococcus sp. TaxID=1506599 RepID=UPI00260374AF|nr:hypothetical protein [uncultured Agitococcus sp.]
MWYALVFLASFLVDLIPFVGPPAWTVMVFFQMRFDLNIWIVLVTGVLGSALGRYILSLYIPFFSDKVLKPSKREDIEFIGKQLQDGSWKVQAFVFFYTMVPMPSVPLFTAAGIARVRMLGFMPAFVAGKFVSDMIMVLSGDYAARNMVALTEGGLSWKSILGVASGVAMLLVFLGIDWRTLMMHSRLRFDFRIWK